jgi:hypothetical protein
VKSPLAGKSVRLTLLLEQEELVILVILQL